VFPVPPAAVLSEPPPEPPFPPLVSTGLSEPPEPPPAEVIVVNPEPEIDEDEP
jgi:hypothetical protein